jgi:hypothetical protein
MGIRWNSVYTMLHMSLVIWKPSSLMCENNMPKDSKGEKQTFTQLLMNLFKPIKNVTVLTCGDIYPVFT